MFLPECSIEVAAFLRQLFVVVCHLISVAVTQNVSAVCGFAHSGAFLFCLRHLWEGFGPEKLPEFRNTSVFRSQHGVQVLQHRRLLWTTHTNMCTMKAHYWKLERHALGWDQNFWLFSQTKLGHFNHTLDGVWSKWSKHSRKIVPISRGRKQSKQYLL